MDSLGVFWQFDFLLVRQLYLLFLSSWDRGHWHDMKMERKNAFLHEGEETWGKVLRMLLD